MSTIERRPNVDLPPLVEGEHLDRSTFHARYEAMSRETRAELIGGTVVMMSPAGQEHGDVAGLIAAWLSAYRRGLPGVVMSVGTTLLLDDQAEPEPDLHLRIRPESGGRVRVEGRYLVGPPELVIEVSRATRAVDLGPKRADYERAGVLEYLVVSLDPKGIHWFARVGGVFEAIASDADGLYRSRAFPGLWLDPAALFDEDPDRLVEPVERGRATTDFAAFRERLARPSPA